MSRSRGFSPPRGRGAGDNPPCRYLSQHREPFDDGWASAEPAPEALETVVSVDASRSVLTRNQSPDVPFDRSVNVYRGCEHGCIYCFARPTHAYLDLSPGLDFETRLLVKPEAPRLLAQALAKPGYRCAPIAMGTNTDPYQPIERHWRLTRGLLELLADCDHPVSIVTKSALVERDLDLLGPMAAQGLAEVAISVTTLDRDLARRLEPRAAAPQRRLDTIARLSDAGVPVSVLVAPLIPVLTEAELERILELCAERGAVHAAYLLLRLPLEVAPLFERWLREHYPLKADHVISAIRQCRHGRDNDSRFGHRLRGQGPVADLIARRFELASKRLGLDRPRSALDRSRFRPPAADGDQMQLF